jgi:hypothetical protein
LGQILRADPVAGTYCLMSLSQKAADLLDQIVL